MRKYLAKLHQKPDHHKRQFALLSAGTITLFIFGVWSLATFGIDASATISNESEEVSPFQSLRLNLASSLEALKGNFRELQSGFGAIDFEAQYQEMKDGALDVYGR